MLYGEYDRFYTVTHFLNHCGDEHSVAHRFTDPATLTG